MKMLRASEIISRKVLEELKKYKKVLIQIPEGLRNELKKIKQELENIGIEYVIDIESAYGYCDVHDEEAIRLGCDVILHIGHNRFGFENLNTKIPVIVQEIIYDLDKSTVNKILEEGYEKIKEYSKIGIVAAIQYKKYVYYLRDLLTEKGFKVFLPRSFQILGCNYTNAKSIEQYIDAFLVPTHGYFYPLGLALETEKKVFSFDLEKGIEDMESYKRKYMMKLFMNIERLKKSKKIGILVSWKKGQIFYNPFKVKNLFKNLGKDVDILYLNEINEEKISYLDYDIFINLSCPRIQEFNFEVPIINFRDLLRFDKRIYELWIQLPETSSYFSPSRDHH